MRLAETSNEKAGDNEQHQRACYLGNHQRAAKELAATSAGRATATIVQHRTDIMARDAQRRENADDHSSDKRRPERKEIDSHVGQELQLKGQVRAQGNGAKEAHGPIAE